MAAAPQLNSTASRAGTFVVAALALVLAWQLAHWTWVFLAPSPTVSAPATEGTADLAVAARLFGGTASGTAVASAATSSLRLKGVVAPTPGTAASAIFNTGAARDLSVYIGNDVMPGVKLVEVLPDAVVVSRAGLRERIELETRKTAPKGGATKLAAGTPQFRLNVTSAGNSFAISRKELDDTLRDPAQLNLLGRISPNSSGGVKMEAAPPGSLAAKLGLQPGDVIKRVNGQTVLSPGDLAGLYSKFATTSTIQAEVQRGSATVQLTYAINP